MGFKEAMTFFAVAAHLNGNMEQERWLLEALLSTGADGLELTTLRVLTASGPSMEVDHQHIEVRAAAAAVAGAYDNLRSLTGQLVARVKEDAMPCISGAYF